MLKCPEFIHLMYKLISNGSIDQICISYSVDLLIICQIVRGFHRILCTDIIIYILYCQSSFLYFMFLAFFI